MDYKLLKKDVIKPRVYQNAITETASKRNTLVVLPTGMGKTLISLLVGINRLEKYPDSKILITSPTRPLNAQHKRSFEKFTKIDPEKIFLITGKIKPEEREKIYKKMKIITATPQCIRNDLVNGRLDLKDFSFITFDEAHRCVKNYAYTFIAKKYMGQSKYPLILGLTASPGGSYKKIDEIRKNLFIDAVEIRSESDEDVKQYVKLIEKEWIYVELPEEFKKIKTLLEERLKEDMFWLRDHRILQTLRPSKKALLMLQKKIGARLMKGSKNYSLFWTIIKLAESIKIEHALELLETQGISSLREYFKKIESSKKRTDKQLIKDPRIREAIKEVERLNAKGIDHPKFEKLLHTVKGFIKKKHNAKIIVFANYRHTVDKINELLKKNGIKSDILIGQAIKKGKGLTQQQQIETLKRFSEGEFNVLCGTQVSEEGLSIVDVGAVIFFESVPSEIRKIQRRGRTGRTGPGKVIFLVTKDTRDVAYMWSAFHKEKKMKGILYNMKKRTVKRKKKNLVDWVK